MPVIPEPAIKNHVARRRKRPDGLLYRDRLLENKTRLSVFQGSVAIGAAHNHQRHSVQSASQSTKKTTRAIQIAVYDQRVNLGFRQLGARPLRFRLNIHADMQTT
jgi:hypothetical protein